ncbi:hypothetical protein SLEP1_g58477 [Rubroshorea leprosula]|uniref:AAA+ ATPase domain-containing protein n=1 Tax=Rubroshorea leprosula TaxID=152421 RepID=A0AAV5MQX6_9ROSI|nr:hypothetical protein SLEP1_g58477 [Rubroshorea leprosula]
MDFIGPILEVLEFVGPPICKYLKYHRKLDDFVSNFQRLQEDLHNRKDAIESRLHAELHFGKRKNPEVTKWLEDVVEITKDAQRVEHKVRKGKYFSRACLGKLLEDKTQEMKLLWDKGNSLQILVLDDPSSSIVPLPTSELVGEEDVKEKIWSYLEDDQVNKIGVCGMGGIGKTTIMKHIHNELLKKAKFSRIVWVTVSQEFDIGKLQKNIANGLNEKLEEDDDITQRAAKLLAILQRWRSFVLILDDVWTGFCLEDVGIPEPTAENGCKVVLTTRLKEVARSMGCEMIDVKPLEKDQALKLFLNKVGNDVLSPTLESTLEMIVDECAGLPLAIVTVAGSMRRISDPRLWKNALNELIEHSRTVADYKIPKDEIIEYWIEEGLIEEMQTRQAMNSSAVLVCDSIEEVTIRYCSDLKRVFGSWFNPLQTLERLNLEELESLKSVFDEEALALLSTAPATTIFPLVSISIGGCHQLKELFSPRFLLSCLQNLETIDIIDCAQMEEIISLGSQEEEKALQLSLPKLWKLKLEDLPALKSICSNISVLRCDSLKYLAIIRCTELKRIPLYLPQLDNGQPLPPPSLQEIIVFPKEWWESLELDHPKERDALLPFCRFLAYEPWEWQRLPLRQWLYLASRPHKPKTKPSVIKPKFESMCSPSTKFLDFVSVKI